MKKFLKGIAILGVLALIYFGYKDLSNKAPEITATDSTIVKVDTSKVDSVKVESIGTVVK